MMKRILFVVEGKTDIFFIKDYLVSLDSTLSMVENNLKKRKKPNDIIIESKNLRIKILMGGGYNTLPQLKNQILEHIGQEYKIYVIQDADDPSKRDGGVTNRIDYLKKKKKELEIEFEIFLFPNNQDNGDLETLLLQIASKNKNYNDFYQCNEKYKINIHDIAPHYSYELDESKYKVFHYFRTFYGAEKAKEENRIYDEKYWDFNSAALKNFRNFILEIIH